MKTENYAPPTKAPSTAITISPMSLLEPGIIFDVIQIVYLTSIIGRNLFKH
jgi:hypothetical protein